VAGATFDELKIAVVAKAEETGVLPSTVRVGGMEYALQMAAETKIRLIQVAKNPARLEDALDMVTFAGTDGTTVHA